MQELDCGDFKVTVNQVFDIDQYPVPKPDELFAGLTGGQCFTKLDLAHAYNQLILDEESRKFVTINTRLRAFIVKRDYPLA